MVGLSATVDGPTIDRPELGPIGDLTIDGLRHHGRVMRLVIHDGIAVWHDHPQATS